jgi:glycosyltransferase involved in cell wall biosynthesis
MLGLSGGLARNGHEVVAYGDGAARHPAEWDETLRRATGAGVDVVAEYGEGTDRRRARLLSRLASNADGLDVLVIHSVFGRSHPAVERACRRGRIPCIACPNDPYSPELFRERRAIKTVYWRLHEAPFLRKMRAIQVLAPSHARFLRDRGIDVPVFAIPNGLEREQLDFESTPDETDLVARTADATAALQLLYFGRWDVYNKGLDLLIEAIGADDVLRSLVSLRIAGRGSDRDAEALRGLIARLGLESQASLVGFLPDIGSAIRSVDFVVLPSRFDGFAQTITEALALGTPVIVSSRAGSSEYFGREDGAIVTEPDVPSLIRSLHDARGSRGELRRAAMGSRPRLVREFSWDEVARRWVDETRRAGAVPLE